MYDVFQKQTGTISTQIYLDTYVTKYVSLKSVNSKHFLHITAQRPRIDLNKRFLPRPKTTSE